MQPYDMVLQAVSHRIQQLEEEMEIIKLQLDISTKTKLFKSIKNNTTLFLEYNIFTILHKSYCEYYQHMKSTYEPNCSLKRVVLKHISAFQKLQLTSIIEEIFGHQCALQTIHHDLHLLLDNSENQHQNSNVYENLKEDGENENLNRNINEIENIKCNDDEGTVESILKTVSFMFPFNIIIPILNDQNFFEFLLKTSLCFINDEKDYKTCILAIYGKLKIVNNLDKYIIVAIAEILLNFFVLEKLERNNSGTIERFYFCQNADLMISRDIFRDLGIEKSFPQINNHEEAMENNQKDNELIDEFYNLKQYEKFIFSNGLKIKIQTEQFEYLQDDYSLVNRSDEIRFFALEFMKIATKVSISMICNQVWRFIDWMKEILSHDNTPVGADETFSFVVCIVCFSKCPFFPKILKTLEKNCVDEFRSSSQIDYYIAQLRAAADFIMKYEKIGTPEKTYLSPYKIEGVTENDAILLEGFVIYAIPKFEITEDPKEKSILCYTGNKSDVSVVYPFSELDPNNKSIFVDTPLGKVKLLTNMRIKTKLILISNNKAYDESEYDVQLVSNLMVLLPKKIPEPKTTPIDHLLSLYNEYWKCGKDVQKDTFERMKKIQQKLYSKKLISNESITGVINVQTVEAIKSKFQFKNGDFFINAHIYTRILSM
ncbi:hypothetical protein TRFO_16333 [Tritrichomonas foetus]|uniref:Uncharacterized protein n=1 Tax=Tritrichomonas foetus TaxID=1144522 RepID=A0A1J4KVD1_9EUKA|nr:hypothetical protein TRFO_16333 [Tritrichomonas foetus]|eukprot:OHT13469.1 hypothetical protein TRFO_16333 [Tritrichomonas foetus]